MHRKRQQPRIRGLAEQLGAHRKRQQAQHPELTLTGMYNVLEKLKAGEPLSAKERDIHQKGLVSVLKTLHDEIDRAVLDAYGWSDLAPLMEIVNGNVVGRSGLQAAMNDDGIEDVGNRAVDGAPTGMMAPPGRSGLQAAMNDDGIEDVGNRAVDGAPTGMVAPPGRGGLQAAMCSDPIDDVRDRAVDGAPIGTVAPPGRSGLPAAIATTRDEAKRLLNEELLDRLVALNAEPVAAPTSRGPDRDQWAGAPSFPAGGRCRSDAG